MDLSLLDSTHVVQLSAIALLAYVCLGGLYRLYLHPLRHIPGPRLAALTWWYEVYYDVILPGQYNFKLQELHKKFGPIIRVNPEEVHIGDPNFLGEIYNARKRNKPPEPSLDIAGSVAGTDDWDLHKVRRQAMTSFFSPKAVRELEPLLVRKRDKLVEVVENRMKRHDGKPLNLSDLYFAYCWDLVQEYAFAFDSTVLRDDLSEAAQLRANSQDLLLQVNFTRHFGWINALAAYLPAGIGEKMIPPGVMDLKRVAARVSQTVQSVVNDKTTTKEEIQNSSQHRSIFYTIRDDEALPDIEKEPLRLSREGNFLVVAASDSPARAIHITHFYLMHDPACMQKLREELRPLGPNPSMEQLSDLPYLNAVFLEGTRLMFGLARRIFRIAPDDAIVYGRYVIPPGTNVATSTYCVHSNEKIFPEPFVFRPERWLGPNAKELRSKYHMTFGAKSPRSCLGIHLAEAEMKFAIAAVARFDMELFETGLKDVEYRHDFQMAHGDLQSKGVRALIQRRAW
ncbi:putative cytochrome P450 [Septoria linicola]|nr:putative cytochrome P450 [Septoria linicola]